MSGGDNIHINLINKTSKKIEYSILTTPNGKNFYIRNGVNANFYTFQFKESGIFNLDLIRIYLQTILFRKKVLSKLKYSNFDYVISSSDFLPDFLPAYLFSKIYSCKPVFSFFLKASSPLSPANPYKGIRIFFGIFYYLIQKMVIKLINDYSKIINLKILLASDSAGIYFKRYISKHVVYGGIKEIIPNYKKLNLFSQYDAVFVGRLHDQKGVIELIKIWREIINLNRSLRLAIIGNGPHEKKMKSMSREFNIDFSIDFLGFLNGKKKYDVFKKSKVFLHTPIYDTGGMALAEGMSYGLPGIVFDLEGYKFCYKQGVIKVKLKDLKLFAKEFINLINDDMYYEKLSKEAINNSKNWLWDNVTHDYLSFIKK